MNRPQYPDDVASDTPNPHNWIYVVVPVGIDPLKVGQYGDKGDRIVFFAYCKGPCHQYFTQIVPFNKDGRGMLTTSDLPDYGCA